MNLFLSKSQKEILRRLAAGDSLRSHRTLDGGKTFRLHRLDGTSEAVAEKVVRALVRRGFITSNQKFPVATFLLTEKGRAAAGVENGEPPLTVRPSE